jgi:hypothetical protein
MVSAFRGVIEFANKLGLYDVVLPFLLVFTVVFAVLEKTKVFGTTKVEDTDVTKKNLNAIIAFVIAFFVVASAHLVEVITKISSNVVLMILFSMFFLILVGMLATGEKGIELEGGWKVAFFAISFAALVLIFFGALGWLPKVWDWIARNWNNEIGAGVFLLIIVVGFMALAISGPKKKK